MRAALLDRRQANAFAKGDISQDKAKTISKAANPDRIDELQDAEDELVDSAKQSTSKQFADKVKAVTDRIDGDNSPTATGACSMSLGRTASRRIRNGMRWSCAIAAASNAEDRRDIAKPIPRSIGSAADRPTSRT